jgi:hypothetical protein
MTRSKAALGILVALAVGFGLGWMTHQNAVAAGSAMDETKEPASAALGSSRANGNESSSRSGRSQSAEKSDLAKRYEKTLSLLTENGNHIPALSFSPDMVPLDRMAWFFDLSPKEFARLKEITASIRSDMLAHEATMATVIDAPDHEYVCEVAADPEFAKRLRERFTQEVGEVVGSEGALLLEASGGRFLGEFMGTRRFTFDIVEHEDGRIERKSTIEMFDENGNPAGSIQETHSKLKRDEDFEDTRFRHLFNPR